MKSFSADTSELLGLEADLRAASADAVVEVRQVVAKGSLNIKNDWRKRWSGLSHMKHLPRTISYDTTVNKDTIVGEIGPDKDREGQAPYGNIMEYGTVNNPPTPGGAPALEAEAPKFEKALEALAAKLVER